MNILKLLLLPVALLYGIAVWIRNQLYDSGIFPSQEFETAVISIGNLSAGGTGKSPMTEYLIRLLSDKYALARAEVLSSLYSYGLKRGIHPRS